MHGFEQLAVTAEGRDLTLQGRLDDATQRAEALSTAKVCGVRAVIDQLDAGNTSTASTEATEPADDGSAWHVAADSDADGRIAWSGQLHEADRDRLLAESELWLENRGFDHQFDPSAGAVLAIGDPAEKALIATLPFLGTIANSSLKASAEGIEFRGRPASLTEAMTVRSALAAATPEGMDLTLFWDRAWQADELALHLAGRDSEWALSGLIPAGSRETWLQAARDAGLVPLRDHLLEADLEAPAGFGGGFLAALPTLVDLDHGRLVESLGRLHISGLSETDGAAGSLTDRLRAALPSGIELDVAVDRGLAKDECQSTLIRRLSEEKIRFASGSAALDAASDPILSDLASTLRRCPALAVSIEGHTDSDGTDAINEPLSRRRADAVVRHLIGLGVDSGRMTSEGFGSSRPIAEGTSAEAKRKNRRIEFQLHEGR